jgi:hypothetical protein
MPAQAHDDLVDDEEEVVLVAQFLHALHVCTGRGYNTAPSGDSLQYQRSTLVGPLAQYHLFNLICRAEAVVGFVGPLGAVLAAVWHGHEPWCEGPVTLFPLLLPASAEGRDGGAVVVALAVEDLVLLAAVLELRQLAHHFEGLLVCLGPGAAVVYAAHPRHLRNQLFRETRRGYVGSRQREVVESGNLVANCIRDFCAAVPT